MRSAEQARQDLLQVIQYLQVAFETASTAAGLDGQVQLGIMARKADGSTNLIASLEASDFLADLKLALNAPEPTEEDLLDAKAIQFLQNHGLKHE